MNKSIWAVILLFFGLIAFSINTNSAISKVSYLADFPARFSGIYTAFITNFQANPTDFRVVKFGRNEDVDAAANEDIWYWGGTVGGDNTLTYPTTGETLHVTSSSAADDLGSTGAQRLLITGISGVDGTEITEIVDMDGTNVVETVNTYLFVNRAAVLLSGSGQKNAGNIILAMSSAGTKLGYIPAGYSVTHQIMYRVPSDRRCYINDLYFAAEKVGGGASPRVMFYVKVLNTVTTNTEYVIREELLDTTTEGHRDFSDFKDQALLSGEIINVEVDTDTNDTEVNATIDMSCVEI